MKGTSAVRLHINSHRNYMFISCSRTKNHDVFAFIQQVQCHSPDLVIYSHLLGQSVTVSWSVSELPMYSIGCSQSYQANVSGCPHQTCRFEDVSAKP